MTGFKILVGGVATVGLTSATGAMLPELPAMWPLMAGSGFCGALVRTIALKERITEGVSTLLIGTISAPFLWQFAHQFFGAQLGALPMDPTTTVMTGGFLTGLAGVQLIKWFLDMLNGGHNDVH